MDCNVLKTQINKSEQPFPTGTARFSTNERLYKNKLQMYIITSKPETNQSTLHEHTHKVKNSGVGFNDDFFNLRGTITYKGWKPLHLLNHCTPELSTQCSLQRPVIKNGHPLLCMFLGDKFSRH
jgi:hypothetical protein